MNVAASAAAAAARPPSPPPNPVTRRALVLSAPYDTEWTDGQGVDHGVAVGADSVSCAQAMFARHLGSSAVATHVNTARTTAAVEGAIQSAFGSADYNDVSHLYIICHSKANVSTSFELSMVINANEQERTLYPATNQVKNTPWLRSILNPIAGKKVVFLDTCYSGAIWDDANGQAVLYKGDSAYGDQSAWYSILCSSTYDQVSWATTDGLGYATFAWAYGAGYSAAAGANLSTLPADSDLDTALSVSELTVYARLTLLQHNFPFSLIPNALPGPVYQNPCKFDSQAGLYEVFG